MVYIEMVNGLWLVGFRIRGSVTWMLHLGGVFIFGSYWRGCLNFQFSLLKACKEIWIGSLSFLGSENVL